MTDPLDPVFFSTFLYSACKVVGHDAWPKWLREEYTRLSRSAWPALRTLDQLLHVADAEVMVDASTYIDRARCVAAGKFLASGKDVWVTCDDDIYAEADVLRRLVLACRKMRGGVAVPYMNRDGRSMTFRKVRGPTETLALDPVHSVSAQVRSVDRVGFGLVALHRQLVEGLAALVPQFREGDLSPLPCPALFVNSVENGLWQGEDYSFSKLCEDAGTPLHVLLEAPCSHAGLLAMLDAEGRIAVADPARAAALNEGIRTKEQAWEASEASACVKQESQGG